MPARGDVDPLSIPRPALAHTMLMDVIWQEPGATPRCRLRYRLMGTGVVASREGLTPYDPTGWYLDEIPFRQGNLAMLHYQGVAVSGRPEFQSGVYALDHPRLAGTYHRLAMPLSNDDREVNMLLAGFWRGSRS
jgi:hypothetical protein